MFVWLAKELKHRTEVIMDGMLSFTKRKLGGSYSWFLGTLVGFVAIASMYALPFPPSLFVVLPSAGMALILLTGRERIDLDLNGRRYRSYFTVAGIGTTSFQPLPELDHALLRDFRTRYRDDDSGQYVKGDDLYELAVLLRGGRRLVLCWTDDERLLIGYVRRLRHGTGLIVQDHTRTRILGKVTTTVGSHMN